MAFGDDFGGFEAAVEAAAARDAEIERAQIGDEDDFSEDLMDSEGLGTVSDQDIAAALGGIASGRNVRGDWGRSRTDQGIAGGRDIRGDWGRTRSSQGIPGGRPGLLGYDYNDDTLDDTGLLDSSFHSDFALSGSVPSYSGPSIQADIVNQEGRLDRWGNAINRFFGMPQDVISQIDSFTEINPDGSVTHADGRITDASGQTIREPTRNWREPWYMDPDRSRYDGEEDRDDSASEYACAAAGGTWDSGTCVMPEDDNGDNGDDEDDEFGNPNPFASLTRKRQMWYHPMLGGTGHGQVYDPYSGERPSHVDTSLWDYMAPRGGAELRNWASDLRKWASGD